MNTKLAFLWFLLGLGSKLQVVASLSITEIIVLLAAPVLFFKDYYNMRRDGIWALFVLSLLVIVGCIVGSIVNDSPPEAILRGMAATCIVSCSIIFAHWILRKCPAGVKWMFLGIALSAFISTFVFQSAGDIKEYGGDVQEIMNSPIYWITRLSPIVMLPTKGWYLQTPTIVSVLAPLFIMVFAMLTSVSGRSAAIGALGFAMFVIIGGKTRNTINRVSRHFAGIFIGGIVFIIIVYYAYKIFAMNGWFGEAARNKYEIQSDGGTGGIGRLILGGRSAAFVGLLACRDKPFVGWGPWAKDENGYAEEFVSKFGTLEDVESLTKMNLINAKRGVFVKMLPCHAYITEFWAWYGIFGLVFWIYIIYILLRYLKQDVAAIPQWYAWLACSMPGMFWGIFFSPFSERFGIPLFVVACLMARAVRKGRFQLPLEMLKEIEKNDRR